MTDEIQHFVEGVSQKGHFDSEGSFTADLEAESHKLAAHRLKNPGDYVLKFLQAAVVGSAPGFEMQVGVRRLQINFEYKPMCCVEGERFLRHLSIGLQSAGQFAKSVSVLKDGKESSFKDLDFSHGGYLNIELKRGITKNSLLSLFHRAAEHRVLARRALYSPIPILIDSWPVPRGWQPLKGDSKFAHIPNEPAFYALQAYLDSPLLPEFDYPIPDDQNARKKQNPVLSLPETGFEPGNNRRCSLAAAVSSELRSEARIDFVQDGVLLERLRTNLGFRGLIAVVSADELEVDLSTLRLVRNESFLQRCQSLLAPLPRVASHLRKHQKALLKNLAKPYFADKGNLGQLNMQSDYSPGSVQPSNASLLQLLPKPSKVVTAWPDRTSVEFEKL